MATFRAESITQQAAAPAGTVQRRESESLDEALNELDDDLRSTLAILHAVNDDLAELTLSALPFGQRAQLEAYDIVQRDEASANGSMVVLTSFGRQFLAACALEQAPQEVRDAITALDAARAEWEATHSSNGGVYSNRDR